MGNLFTSLYLACLTATIPNLDQVKRLTEEQKQLIAVYAYNKCQKEAKEQSSLQAPKGKADL